MLPFTVVHGNISISLFSSIFTRSGKQAERDML
jgi:hypothetical protein